MQGTPRAHCLTLTPYPGPWTSHTDFLALKLHCAQLASFLGCHSCPSRSSSFLRTLFSTAPFHTASGHESLCAPISPCSSVPRHQKHPVSRAPRVAVGCPKRHVPLALAMHLSHRDELRVRGSRLWMKMGVQRGRVGSGGRKNSTSHN